MTYLMYKDEQTIDRYETVEIAAPESLVEWEVNNFMSSPETIQRVQDIAYDRFVSRMNLRLDTSSVLPLKIDGIEA